MNLDVYQAETAKTAFYPDSGKGSFEAINYALLGLGGEAGEILNKWKKIIRDKNKNFTLEDAQIFAGEIGDILWYCSQLSTEIGIPLRVIAKKNLEKLNSRKERGVLGGSGDTR